jgi:hypothetical protein
MQKKHAQEILENDRKITNRDLRTVRQICEAFPAFKSGTIRWWLFHRRTNGFDRAVVKVGRRVLIDTYEFFAWIDEQNGR